MHMKGSAFYARSAVVVLCAFAMRAPASAQSRTPQRPAPPTSASPDNVAEAYAQFLIGHHLDETNDEPGAIAAYTHAMDLDPTAADIPAELAALYLRENKITDAIAAAERALKVAPANREGNRVLGIIYAGRVETDARAAADANRGRRSSATPAVDNAALAIKHLELAVAGAPGEADPNLRATLARLYLHQQSFEKAIPLLSDLVKQEPGWTDGPSLLTDAFAGAGRNADAIAWLEARAANDPSVLTLATLADFYEREHRWKDAADAYAKAMTMPSRGSSELKRRYASALLQAGGRENLVKARDQLSDIVAGAGATDARAWYMLSQAQRRLGDGAAAEQSARRVIAENSESPWGYYALAEALEARRQYQSVVDELAPVVAENRGKSLETFDVSILLPHLGFAYQEVGQHDKAIAAFEDARKLSPGDPAVAGYLIEANIAARKYGAAIEAAKTALTQHPNDLRLTRLEAQALRHDGKTDQGIALLEEAVKHHADDPTAYISLAQTYSDAERGAQAVKVLQEAQGKFPTDDGIAFELGTVFDKQKRFADAESAFRQVLSRDPENAIALNYLGYMLAERGERLDESVSYLKKALEVEPENPSYLDSLGWAYFKSDKLDLAESNLKRAADQLKTNSVIQEHYGQVLFKLGRYDEAIAAW
ncbi:MAG TPA: tetratricopeptide repeat protein, partial [Vicinamibacterales bacterium]|nr:tetratricopeptide repeat protein [Vicinamibacterales bacterium]